ncbi:hypothetical protein SAMN05661008_00986 [Alkalithermobacter thermoalcaliphilus JW-YL-7 = DSM 7308]|uniref:DUF2225 domain-containing protein n=1 Tax=Alkalithermobacter thermoalcaliphilus JW-YL-7 = DSM 7308 TaxID=1121328 RepID=A0A150FQ10_CLOPD|nr:Protein of unknown function DUF2225 [[Clostridium] paradoxum JW-YL-7 = DSM 7308]SHK84214.1 hypothetical protein SAMN05661008_00986 [[Clostridium] paradoxum JW-YL-7 = DSM 7308]
MQSGLYDKKVKCPICSNIFTTKKVRTSAIRTLKRDSDLCIHYKTVNPYFYAVFVCPKCGYAATENRFLSIKRAEIDIIKDNIMLKWTYRDFGGERGIDEAIVTHKLALYQADLLCKDKFYIGNICLKIAWLYRYISDEKMEDKFLRHSLDCLEYAFYNENYEDKTYILAYLIGELSRRLKNYKEAINWFQIALKDNRIKNDRNIENLTRDQWRLASEEYKNAI